MALTQGFDFRATSGYVSDPTNYAVVKGDAYPQTYSPSGVTGGWEDGGVIDQRDRNNAIDARLAGVNWPSVPTTNHFRVDLPATGNYAVQAAIGDDYSAQGPFTCTLNDTTTVLKTVVNNASTGGGGQYYSANGTLETSPSNWATANPNAGGGADEQALTFSTTIFRLAATNGTGICTVASLFIRSVTTPVAQLPYKRFPPRSMLVR